MISGHLRTAAANAVGLIRDIAKAGEMPTGGWDAELFSARDALEAALKNVDSHEVTQEWLVWCHGAVEGAKPEQRYYLVVDLTDENAPFDDDDFNVTTSRAEAWRASSKEAAHEMAARAGWEGYKLTRVNVWRKR